MHEVGIFIKNIVFTKWIEFSQRLKVNIEYQISQKKQKKNPHLINGPLFSPAAFKIKDIYFFLIVLYVDF